MIPFGGTYTRAQWGRGIRLAMHPTGLPLVLRLLALALALGMGVLLGVGYLRGETLSSARLLRTLVSLLFLAGWAGLPYVRAWQEATKPFRAGQAPLGLRGRVTDDGILSNAGESVPLEKWDRFLQARLQEDLVVLIGVDGLATILPRPFFAGDDDWTAFQQLVRSRVVPPR